MRQEILQTVDHLKNRWRDYILVAIALAVFTPEHIKQYSGEKARDVLVGDPGVSLVQPSILEPSARETFWGLEDNGYKEGTINPILGGEEDPVAGVSIDIIGDDYKFDDYGRVENPPFSLTVWDEKSGLKDEIMVKTQVLRDGKVNSEMLKNDLQIDPDDKQKLLAFMRLAERGLYNWEEFRGQFLISTSNASKDPSTHNAWSGLKKGVFHCTIVCGNAE